MKLFGVVSCCQCMNGKATAVLYLQQLRKADHWENPIMNIHLRLQSAYFVPQDPAISTHLCCVPPEIPGTEERCASTTTPSEIRVASEISNRNIIPPSPQTHAPNCPSGGQNVTRARTQRRLMHINMQRLIFSAVEPRMKEVSLLTQ